MFIHFSHNTKLIFRAYFFRTIKDRHSSFQGQEKDDELKGEGNSLNYTFRMHDPRVGRFFATDPLTKKYPWYSPYQFAGNKVIKYVELEGLEEGERAFRASLQLRNPQAYELEMKAQEMNSWKNVNPMEALHTILDGLGFVPVIGEAADGLNAAIYTYKGDYLNASFSAVSLVPVAGDIGAKGLKYTLKFADDVNLINKGAGRTFKSLNAAKKWLGNAMEFGVKSADAIANRSKLKGALKIVEEGIQAHHIIPVEAITKSEVVQKAVDAGFDFNGKINGVGIKSLSKGGTHTNHPNYTKQVLNNLEKLAKENPNYTAEQAKEYLEKFATKLNDKIKKESVEGATKVNDLKF
ncbi:AHH domain-containing protein [Flavobacterium covae]|uniref:AHH domain-containing protein n=1 Tax=Flavobacterium covae TaxID=2906076 RepID=UPI003392CE56